MLTVERDTNHRRPRLLMCAFSCIPFRGSEPGLGWNRAMEAAKYCDTWVLCCTQECQQGIARYFQQHETPAGLNFVYVPFARWAYGRPGQFYLAYRNWLRRAYRVAARLHREVDFDLTHYVTFSTYREPGFFGKLGIPYIWGPLGGTQNYPWRCIAGAGPKAWVRESLRNVINSVQLRCSGRVKKAARSASLVLAANSLIADDLRRFYDVEVVKFTDTGISSIPEPRELPAQACETTRIIWSGVHEPRKALELLLDALELLPKDLDFEVRVLGEGVYQNRWRKIALRKGLGDRIHWLGRLPHEQALAEFRDADLFAFTSLRDTTGTVLMEALGAGLPVVCLDHQGARDVVTDLCGVKVPVTTRRKIARDLCRAIVLLARDRELAGRMGVNGRRRAKHYLWENQGRRMAQVYNEVLAKGHRSAGRDLSVPDEPAAPLQSDPTPLTVPTPLPH